MNDLSLSWALNPLAGQVARRVDTVKQGPGSSVFGTLDPTGWEGERRLRISAYSRDLTTWLVEREGTSPSDFAGGPLGLVLMRVLEEDATG